MTLLDWFTVRKQLTAKVPHETWTPRTHALSHSSQLTQLSNNHHNTHTHHLFTDAKHSGLQIRHARERHHNLQHSPTHHVLALLATMTRRLPWERTSAAADVSTSRTAREPVRPPRDSNDAVVSPSTPPRTAASGSAPPYASAGRRGDDEQTAATLLDDDAGTG